MLVRQNYVFDKYWYKRREFEYTDAIYKVFEFQFQNQEIQKSEKSSFFGRSDKVKLSGQIDSSQ